MSSLLESLRQTMADLAPVPRVTFIIYDEVPSVTHATQITYEGDRYIYMHRHMFREMELRSSKRDLFSPIIPTMFGIPVVDLNHPREQWSDRDCEVYAIYKMYELVAHKVHETGCPEIADPV